MKLFNRIIAIILMFNSILKILAFSNSNSNLNTNQVHSKSSTSSLSGIFGSFKLHFNKKGRSDLKLKKIIPPNLTVADVLGSQLKNSNTKSEDLVSEIRLGEPPFFKGWIQYFKYSSDGGLKKPEAFYKNEFYSKQLMQNSNINPKEKENNEFIYIPSETHFYATLFESTLNIANSKKDKYSTAYDIINIPTIMPVSEEAKFKGGVEDFGSFKEGHCFKVKTESGEIVIWIICTETSNEKFTLMSTLKKLKLREQRNNGLVFTSASNFNQDKPLEEYLNPGLKLEKDKMKKESANTKPSDGYWITIQNWSQCSLKCGGGETVLQRMCVPPKQGGKPCFGEAIVKAPCNLQPCPKVSISGSVESTEQKVQVLEPKVKILNFSTRPQKYTKCVIKESDLLYSFIMDKNSKFYADYKKLNPNNSSSGNKDEIFTMPARVVMNDKSISVYSGDNYDSLKVAFYLAITDFSRSTKRNCFILKNVHQTGEFCFLGSENSKESLEQWDYDFNLFKNQCKTKKPIVLLDDNDKKEIDAKLDEKRRGMLLDKELDTLKKQKEKEIEEKELTLKKTHKLALQALQKQINYEGMIKKEEQAREDEEIEKLEAEILKEKEKQSCAMKRIKEKEIENQYNIRSDDVDVEDEELRKKVQDQIIEYRNNLKNKLKQMQKITNRKKQKLKDELKSLRNSFSKQMMVQKGKAENCIYVLQNKDNYKDYCLRMFPNSPEDFGKCLSSNNPCNSCCEHEFSETYLADRKKCFTDICANKRNFKNGRWVWEEDLIQDG